MKANRKKYSAEFKAKIALETLKVRKTSMPPQNHNQSKKAD